MIRRKSKMIIIYRTMTKKVTTIMKEKVMDISKNNLSANET